MNSVLDGLGISTKDDTIKFVLTNNRCVWLHRQQRSSVHQLHVSLQCSSSEGNQIQMYRQISKSTSASAPSHDWLDEMLEEFSTQLWFRFPFFSWFLHSKMASAHDRAVLQAIFNPSTPFGDPPGLDQEEEFIDEGEPLTSCVSTYHVKAFYVYHFPAYWIDLNAFPSWTEKKTKKHDILIPSWVVCDVSVFLCHSTCQLGLSAFSGCLSPPARQRLRHTATGAGERLGDAGRLGSGGRGFGSSTATVQPGDPDAAAASFGLQQPGAGAAAAGEHSRYLPQIQSWTLVPQTPRHAVIWHRCELSHDTAGGREVGWWCTLTSVFLH